MEHKNIKLQNATENTPIKAKFLFIGTGTSEGIPIVSCLVEEERLSNPCKVCNKAILPGNKNRRRNTGAAVIYGGENGEQKVILIDCGKLWWESVLELFPKHSIKTLNAVLLTHPHHDAVGGLDNLRDFNDNILKHEIPVYLDEDTLTHISSCFPYLIRNVDPSMNLPKLDPHIIQHNKPFDVEDLTITAIPVNHGYINCNAFEIGELIYISDIKIFDNNIIEICKKKRIIIVDCLTRSCCHPSHVGFTELIPFIEELNKDENISKKIYLTGMEHSVDHDSFSEEVKEYFDNVELAYDGLIFDFNARI